MRYAARALLAAAALAGGCGREAPDPVPPREPPPAAGEVDPGRLRPGDLWLGLRVDSLQVRPDAVDGSGYSGRVRLSGPLALSGTYRPHPEYPEPPELCFFPDSASAARLPRFPNDRRVSWFCFEDPERARRDLGGPGAAGEASIVVDAFVYHYEHTDVYNTARLRRVVSRPGLTP